MIAKTVALIGTFDTKGEEFRFLRDRIESAGLRTLMIDVGVLGSAAYQADISQADVAAAANENLAALRAERDRGRSVAAMAAGAKAILLRLFEQGVIHGVVSLGGSAGTTIASAAMRALPFGFPKLIVSTLASGDIKPYVGTSDICMMPSVLDIAGLNHVSRRIIGNAAAAICGMVIAEAAVALNQKHAIAATMFGVTTPCVTAARHVLEERGFEVLVFHATGTGGQAMEQLIEDGAFRAVLDVTTTELADELVGGVMSAGPGRLEAAGRKGIPQVVCPGAIDMVNFGPLETVPAQFRTRNLYIHNPSVTLMRTTSEECAEIARITATRLNRASGPVTFVIPLQGVSAIDRIGGPFYSPEALDAYRRALKASLSSDIRVVELDAHINDEGFAVAAAELLIESLDPSVAAEMRSTK
ncbi:MAG TPA: Tm-1-like ATP-binding domain-containing protein [Terracidiphilus sp.]|nr:Tm-1-like ATP-binding domain-containing protein [Terracidiphilus sp.]